MKASRNVFFKFSVVDIVLGAVKLRSGRAYTVASEMKNPWFKSKYVCTL